MQALEAAIGGVIEASGAARVAVVAGPLGRDRSVLIEPDAWFHAASTMKVAVLLELYRQAWAGAVSLDEPLPVRNAFRSIADGSGYVLRPADDSELDLYDREGEAVPLRELAFRMITVSSNLATNLLVDRLGGGPVIQATLDSLGIEGVSVLRGVEDDVASERGLNNTTTARGLATLLERIALRTAAPPEACDAMLEVPFAQAFNEGIPAGLPAGARVAHKTGSITALYHDAGIVYPSRGEPYVLVVLTQGLEEKAAAPALVAEISRCVSSRFAFEAEVEALIAYAHAVPRDDDELFDRRVALVHGDRDTAFDVGHGLLSSADPDRREMGLQLMGVAAGWPRSDLRDAALPHLRRALSQEVEIGPLSTAILHIGHLGDEASRAGVIAKSGHPDAVIRSVVAFALPALELDEAAVHALCELTLDEDDDTRDWATFGLAWLTDWDSEPLRAALVARLEDPDETIRNEAIVGLCRRQDERVRTYLERELADPTHSDEIDEAAVFLADGSGRIL